MNTLRRVTRHMVKAVAAGAVLVAAGIPVVMAGTAGAATSPTLYCSQNDPTLTVNYNYAGNAYCGSMPWGYQNGSLTVNLSGAGLAFDLGTASATTNATGVTVTSVTENNANSATVQLSIGASVAPGYYSITLTDDNGTATLKNAFGVDPSSTITNVTPTSIPEGATTLVTVTGTGLRSGTVYSDGNPAGFSVTSGKANGAGTSLTFYVSTTSTLALGTYSVGIVGANTTDAAGNPGVNITVTGASISSISPSQLNHNTTSTSVTQNITITGSGFVAGAVVRINGSTLPYAPFAADASTSNLPEVQFGTATVVNATTITVPVTIAASSSSVNSVSKQWDVQVTNPNGTTYDALGALGWLTAGNAAYTTPQLTMVADNLVPGPSTVDLVANGAFPVSYGDSVTLSFGRFTFTGAVVSATAGSGNTTDVTVGFDLPAYLATTLTQAVTTGATNLPVASLSGISTGTMLTFVDSTAATIQATSVNTTTNTVQVGALGASHAAGTSLEFPIGGVAGWTLAYNNGANTLSVAGLGIGAQPAPSFQYKLADGTGGVTVSPTQLAPGTYTLLMTLPGANFASTGATISFPGTNVTGTITATGADTATVVVTVPSTTATTTYTPIASTTYAGNNLTVGTPGTQVGATTFLLGYGASGTSDTSSADLAKLSAGSTYVIDNGLPSQESVTISPTWNGANPISLTAAMKFAHAAGATITTASSPAQSSSGNITAIVTNGAGLMDILVGPAPGFFGTFTANEVAITSIVDVAGTAMVPNAASPYNSNTQMVLGAGASRVPVDIQGTFGGTGTTTVSVNAAATATSITVTDPTQLYPGEAIVINGSIEDSVSPTWVSGNPVALTSALGTSVSSGANVVRNPADFVVSSTTPGVTFGPVTAVDGSNVYTTVSVAAGTPVNTNVQYSVTTLNGLGSAALPSSAQANSWFLIGNTPTITGVTGLPASMQPGETATFSVTGTLFDAATVASLNAGSAGFLADTGNLAGSLDTGSVFGYGTSWGGENGVVVSGCVLNSSTSITCSVTVHGGATNGAHDLMISNGSYGTAVFANALNVANATIGAISPTFYQSDSATATFTLSGIAGLSVGQAASGGVVPSAKVTTFYPSGAVADQKTGTVNWVASGTVSVTVTSSIVRPAGGYMVVTLNQDSSVTGTALSVDAPLISLGLPLVVTGASQVDAGFWQPAGTSGTFAIGALGSSFSAPFDGQTTFQPGAKVTVVPMTNSLGVSMTAGITLSGVTVLPGLITGSIAVSLSTPSGYYQLQVLNPDGGVAYSWIYVSPAPSVDAVNGVSVLSGPVSFLSGTKTTLIIHGSNLQTGAVVSASVPGDATFGTAVVTPDNLPSTGVTLTVPVTFTSFSGATPVVLDLTVTNPDGGVVTVPGEIVLNPQPAVTGGPYYVPTFTTNTQLVVTGTGFQAGMTVASSNSAYTVSVANVSPTAVTLLVSTSSAATSGTSSTLTFTNPDGGTTTMTLNGGPVPGPVIKVSKVASAVWTGKRTVTHILGQHMYGQPSITSNVGGTRVQVSHNTGSNMTIIVTVAKNVRRGVHTFTVTFKNGEVFHVKYNQR